MPQTIYDIIGIGIGPFNLGLAALADSIPNLKCLFFDQDEEFNWHPGLMLDNARLQVPFYADLVTLADPCSRFSFLAFLKAKGRMFRFAILENNFILRKEYNEYCTWVVEQIQQAGSSPASRDRNDKTIASLPPRNERDKRDDKTKLKFGFRCEAVRYDEFQKVYSVFVRDVKTELGYVYYSRNIVVGVGSVPNIPPFVEYLTPHPSPLGEGSVTPLVIHSSDYLYFEERLLNKKSLAIVGLGQSAAEIFHDLLGHSSRFSTLKWFTRNHEFFPMDYSSFALEKTSPDYIDHFYSLSPEMKKKRLKSQDHLYKGINSSLIQEIYGQLYGLSLSQPTGLTLRDQIGLFPSSELKRLTTGSDDEIELTFHHSELNQDSTCSAEAVILATGYKQAKPSFLEPIEKYIDRTDDGQLKVKRSYSIDQAQTVFVQNAELHTHGFNAPDLGMGPYRNATILNTILGTQHFIMEKGVTFQNFGPR